MQYRARKGNPAYPRLHNGWNIRYGYSTDGYYRKVYILLLHPVMIAVYPSQSQYRTQILLGSGVGGRGRSYVVGTGFVVLQYILKSIGGTAIMYSAPRIRRASAMGMSFFPRCTPSACSFRASSTWSSMMKVAPYCGKGPALPKLRSIVSTGVSFMRSCTQRQPPQEPCVQHPDTNIVPYSA